MHVLIAVTLLLGCAAIIIYAIWCVAQDLLIRSYAPATSLADLDDYDAGPKAIDSHDGLRGDRVVAERAAGALGSAAISSSQ
jgi:hypothetical protein